VIRDPSTSGGIAPDTSTSPRPREPHDARSDVHRDAVHVAVGHLHLPGVQAGSDAKPRSTDGLRVSGFGVG
jgi:hypothetical protein